MFHWICPECGREIPPAVTECPACDPKSAAEAGRPAAAVSHPESAPDLLLALAEQIRAAQIAPAATAVPAPPPVDQVVPQAVPEQVTEKAAAPPPQLAAPEEPKAEPVVIASTPAGLTELANALGLSESPAPEPAAPAEQSGPAPVQTASAAKPESVATATAASPVALLAPPEPAAAQPAQEEVAPAPAVALAPAEIAPARDPEPVALAEPAPPQPIAPVEPASPIAMAELTPTLAAELAKPQATGEPEPLPSKPPSGSWLPMAPLQNYKAAASRAMQPIAPVAKILTPDSGPRITLPGPALPPELNSLQDSRVMTGLGDQGKKLRIPGPRSIPGWIVSFLVMTALLGGGVALVFYMFPAHSAADAKTALPAALAPAPAPEAAAVQPASHPLSEYIEVTGFRFVVDLNKKSEIHYLVVNHSANELTDMTIYVTLRTANSKLGQPPLCRFSFRSPGLAPFESKEMTSPIEKLPRTVALPDWQDLRPEVQIAQ